MDPAPVAAPPCGVSSKAQPATSSCVAIPFFVLRTWYLALLTFLPLSSLADATVTNCTRQALIHALAAGGTVTYTQDCSLTLSNQILISNDVTLLVSTGRTVTLSGGNLSRIFAVASGANFEIRGLRLTAGRSTAGAALYIHPGASVTLSNCTLSANYAVGPDGGPGTDGSDQSGIGNDGAGGNNGDPAYGGAIYNAGSLAALRCTFLTNNAFGGNGGDGGDGGDGGTAGGNGGNGGNGAPAYGGAIYNDGTLLLRDCSLESNSAWAGDGGNGGAAGAGAFPGLPGNGGLGASAYGAGIYNTRNATFLNCTFSANITRAGHSAHAGTDSDGTGLQGKKGADALGGAIFNSAAVVTTNCTFVSNRVTAGNGGNGGNGQSLGGDGGNGGNAFGGGVYSSGTQYLVNCTLSQNAAVGGTNGVAGSAPFPGENGTPGVGHGGGIARASGNVYLQNSIVAASTAGNGYGTISDRGYNISSDGSIALSGTSKMNTPPRLVALANNGGPTKTLALQTNSPAIDKVLPSLSPPIDQRGTNRPIGALADIGAYESELSGPPVITQQPQDVTIAQSNSATFTVVAAGAPTLRYRWFFNGAPLTSATSATLTIANAQPTNTGGYRVVVTNNLGSVTSRVASLLLSNANLSMTLLPPPGTNAVSTNLAFSFVGATGQTYVVESKVSLTETNWRPLRTNIGMGLLQTNTFPATNRPSSFFRIRRL